MKNAMILAAFGLILLTACGGDRQERIKIIEDMENEAFRDDQKFDVTQALGLINTYGKFAEEFPQDAEAPKYLFKAGDFSMGLEKSEQAIMYFDKVINDYPDYEKVPYCHFLKAFIYENQLQDLHKAKELYTAFLDQYPDHDMAESARFSLKNLGRPNEEIIQQFDQQESDSIGI